MSNLRDVMSSDVTHLSPNDNLYEAALLMRQNDIGAIPVCENGQLRGMITDRDIVVRGIAQKKPSSSEIQDVMSRHLVYGNPDMSIDEASKLMADSQVRRLPVVENNQLVGIVSIGDLAVRDSYMNEASDALSQISHNTDHRGVQH